MTIPLFPDSSEDDPTSLTHFIEIRFHASHRRQLPELLSLAQKVERVHAGDPQAPAGLAKLLEGMAQELEVHMRKEEAVLFPAIRQGGMLGLEHPIAVMRADHDEHDKDIAAICNLTNNLSLPLGACRSWAALYEGLGQFIADFETHMHLENDVLFPKFEKPHQHQGCGCACQGHD